jgi:hypothetical protein
LIRTQRWAINFEQFAHGRFNEEALRANTVSVWKGCFAAPRDFRHWKNKQPLTRASCPAHARGKLFRAVPNMPPGCEIKGKYAIRAALTGHVGILSCARLRQLSEARSFSSSSGQNQRSTCTVRRRSYTCWLQ